MKEIEGLRVRRDTGSLSDLYSIFKSDGFRAVMDHSGKDVHQIFAFVEQRIGINIRITAKLEKSVLGLN